MRAASTTPQRIARASRLAIGVALMSLALGTGAQDLRPLPPAQPEGGKPLMQALKERRSTRALTDTPLAAQQLSNLLWAAFGVNRADGHRTAPSARNWQEIDVYVVMAEGSYVYDAPAQALRRVTTQDLRALAGTQPHARNAALTLVYVADARRMEGASEATRAEFAAADAGFIAQNVYLFCASEGLGTVVFASIDRERLAAALKLDRSQRIVLGQSVGWPAK
jgi:SagB-type dehydrogenase family enzyme